MRMRTGLIVGVLALAAATIGCAVSETDVQRWETTENGPEKLYAIVTHDKYSWELREDAAISLIHMRPRNGKRVGLEHIALGFDTQQGKVPGALSVMSEEARRKVVDGVAQRLIDEMKKPAPAHVEGQAQKADETIAYKDAAFAILAHDPPLASNEETKAALTAALTQWVQTDFEARVDNSSQQYGLEQIMRFIGPPAVKQLPGYISESGTKVDHACRLVADIGDDDGKKRASEALVAMAKRIDSPDWIDKQRPLVVATNQKTGQKVDDKRLAQQIKDFQEQELEKVFANMKRVGGRPAVEYCLSYAHDKSKSEKMRSDALAALENRVDKSNVKDVDTLFDVLKDDANPDKVRGIALARFGELPKELIVPKLYTLFDAKKWQVRSSAADLVLRSISTKDLSEFLKRLPTSDRTKIGLSEVLQLAARIMAMDPAGGPKPRDVLGPYMQSHELEAKLLAIGAYYQGKKSDAPAVMPLQGDPMPMPKCDKADECGWDNSCAVGKDVKAVTTVGEFVKWCIVPSLQ